VFGSIVFSKQMRVKIINHPSDKKKSMENGKKEGRDIRPAFQMANWGGKKKKPQGQRHKFRPTFLLKAPPRGRSSNYNR